MEMIKKDVKFEDLLGKTLCSITNEKYYLLFSINNRIQYIMEHDQDCCEDVYVEDICGDLNDIIDSPILLAEKITSNTNPEGIEKEYQDSFTWTFYKLSTIKGSVTIRWYGSSNGCYSEEVSFYKEIINE